MERTTCKGRCGVFAGKTVWSTPERLRGEVLTTRRYTNLRLPLPLRKSHSTHCFYIVSRLCLSCCWIFLFTIRISFIRLQSFAGVFYQPLVISPHWNNQSHTHTGCGKIKRPPKKTYISRERYNLNLICKFYCQGILPNILKVSFKYLVGDRSYRCLNWKVLFYNWTLVITTTAVPKMRIKLIVWN